MEGRALGFSAARRANLSAAFTRVVAPAISCNQLIQDGKCGFLGLQREIAGRAHAGGAASITGTGAD